MTTYPSARPGRKAFQIISRGIRKLGVIIGITTLVTALIVVSWNLLLFLMPGLPADATRALASHGMKIPSGHPLSPGLAGAQPDDGSDSYAFMQAGADQPFVTYNPCRPIHYVIRPQNAPEDAEEMVQEAVAAVSQATGFVFIYDGLTDEAPSMDRPEFQRDRYGDRWAPVLIAWETEERQPEFTGNRGPGSENILGLGGSAAVSAGDQGKIYLTGQIWLNAAALETKARFPGGKARVTAVIKHELGHVVGLDHVEDPSQLMAAGMKWNVTDFAAGDLKGLAMLGKGKCRPDF